MKLFIISIVLLSNSICVIAKGNKENKITIEIADDIYKKSDNQDETYKSALNYLLNNGVNAINIEDKKRIIEKKRMDESKLLAVPKPTKFISDVVYSSLTPGNESVKVFLSSGLPVTLVFKDRKGQPVNIYGTELQGLPFAVDKLGGKLTDSSKDSSTPTRPQNILILQTSLLTGGANLPVFTTFSDLPVSIDVSIKPKPDKTYIDRLIVIVGDDSDDDVVDKYSLDSRNMLMRVLNNLPPSDKAQKLHFGNGISAWKVGNDMWIRTSRSLYYPIPNPKISSEINGIKAYKTKYSSVLTIKEADGHFLRVIRDS